MTITTTQLERFRQCAKEQAEKDPADPHVYKRTMTHLVNGLFTPGDYKERREGERT